MFSIDYSRDSFDDRICGDLTQVLISYLSFEDKIRFECVSKQFRELVFERQRKLLTEKWNRYQFDGISFFSKCCVEYDLKAFASVLTKSKSLDDIAFIDMRPYSMTAARKYANQVIELVIKHCRPLKSVRFDYFEADDALAEWFFRKFGQNLVHIEMYSKAIWSLSHYRQPLIKLCPNLVSIKGLELKDLIIGNELIVLKSLSKVHRMIIESYEEILFTDFINKYENQLKSLDITFCGQYSDNFFVNISRLKQLNEFSLHNIWDRNSSQLFNGLKQIGLNCKHLNKLALDLHILEDDTKSFNQSLKDFKDLKQLKIEVNFANSLSFEKFSERIHIRFPKLESLEFRSCTEVNDNGLKCLAELKTLRKFTLISYDNSNITSEGILHLINSDNKLFYIDIESKFEITDGLIDGLKALTARFPKRVLKINFNFSFMNENELKFRGIPGIYCFKHKYD